LQVPVDPLDPDERLRLLGRLLEDESLDLQDRVAGCLLLLFAQPISRLVRLTKNNIHEHQGRLSIRLGREPLLLPDPLAALARQLKERESAPASTGVKLDSSRWLFPGLRLDTPIHEEAMRRRLRRLGITGRAARNAAALQLAKTLPAVLADLLGVHEATAEDWTQLAARDWAPYAASR
jgi:integrase